MAEKEDEKYEVLEKIGMYSFELSALPHDSRCVRCDLDPTVILNCNGR